MRGARPVIVCLLAALALSGCMGRTAPVAVAPQASLDTIAYGQRPYAPAPMAVAYPEPAPVRHDAPYHLDAGDKLRVVVYGQEGLTNGYAIDAAPGVAKHEDCGRPFCAPRSRPMRSDYFGGRRGAYGEGNVATS